jgi:hypothetical protein
MAFTDGSVLVSERIAYSGSYDVPPVAEIAPTIDLTALDLEVDALVQANTRPAARVVTQTVVEATPQMLLAAALTELDVLAAKKRVIDDERVGLHNVRPWIFDSRYLPLAKERLKLDARVAFLGERVMDDVVGTEMQGLDDELVTQRESVQV